MSDVNDELLSQVVVELRQTNRWLRILATPLMSGRLRRVLKKDEEWRVYQASSGESMQIVGKAAGVSHQTVSNYWKAWAKSGIVEETETPGRYRKLFDVEESLARGTDDRNTRNGN